MNHFPNFNSNFVSNSNTAFARSGLSLKMKPLAMLLPSALLLSTLPLKADTGTILLSPSADTRIFDANWGWNQNDGNGTDIGIYQSRDRSLLQFNFGALPTGFTVNNAALALTTSGLFGGNPTAESMNIYRLTQGWTEGGVTWNNYDGTNAWTTAGGTFDNTVMATSTANPGLGQQVVWNITTLAQGWANNTWTNNGLIIINSGTTNGLHFASDENGNVAARPLLTTTITTSNSPAGGAWIWNGGTGGGGAVDGAGVWTDPNLWWNGAAATWADGNDAVFGAGSGAAGTVTISGTVAPKSIWFQTTGGGNYTLDGGTIDLGGSVRVIHTSIDGTINSTITNGTIFKQGSATLTLAGANTHTGGTTIAGGILKAGSSSALGAAGNYISISSGASLDINGQTLNGYTQNIRIAGTGATASLGALGNSGAANLNAIRGITLTGNASIGGDGGRWDIGRLDFNADPNSTVVHIDGGGFVLTKVGSNEIGILGGATNLAGFVLNAGTVTPHENTAFGSGPVTINGGLFNTWGGLTQANAFTINGGTIRQASGHNDNYTGAFTLNAASSFEVNAGSLTVSGPMSGSGAISKTGGSPLILSGNNTQTGTLSVSGGWVRFASATGNATNGNVEMLNPGSFLVMDAPNQFGPNAGLLFNSAGHSEFALYGNNQTIASLASTNGLAVVQNSHGGIGAATANSTLTINQSSNTTYSGIIRDNTGNDAFTLALVKDGSGTLTLNTTSGHSGGTTVNGGTLAIVSNGGNSGVKESLTVNAGGTVSVSGDGTGLGYNGGQKITSLNINGGTVTSTGVMHIWGIGGAGVNMTGGTLQSNSGTSNANGSQLEWNNTNVTTNASATTATIGGRINLRTDNGATGITFSVADGAAATDLKVSAAITQTGAQALVKQGAGSMLLSGANSFTGGSTLQAGTINIGHDTALGGGQLIVDGGAVAFDNAGLYEGLVSSSNSFDISTPVPSGTIVWDTVKGHTTSSAVFADNTTWGYKGTIVVPDGSPVSWTFGKQFDDSVKLDLNGESGVINNNSWNTPIAATRTLQPGRNDIEVRFGQGGGGVGPNSGWSIGFGVDTQGRGTTDPANFLPLGNTFFTSMLQHDNTVANSIVLNATTEFQTSYNYSVNKLTGVLSGNGGLTKTGVGILTLANSMTYAGTTTVNGGTLRVENSSAAGSIGGAAPVVINSGGTLEVRALDGLGYHNNVGTNSITVNEGGKLTVAAGFRSSTDRNLNIVGGTVTSAQGVAFDSGASYTLRDTYDGGAGSNTYTFTSASSGTPATLSAKDVGLHGPVTFNVTDGPGAIDLAASGNLVNIFGTGSVIKAGAGTMTLTANNTYSGTTTINGGTLITGAGGVGMGAVTIASGATLSTTSAASTGLAALYYNNAVNQGNIASIPALLAHFGGNSPAPSLVQTTASMNFANNGSGFPAPYNSGGANFEAFYSGKLNISSAGTYTFNTSSDDGSMLFIDGQAVVTNNFDQGVTTRTGSIALTPGMHDIVIAYNQGGGGYGMNAQMSGADNVNMVDINTANAAITPDLVVGSISGAGNVVLSTGNLITGIDNSSTSFSGIISGIGSMTKFGPGTLTLTGANTYTGATRISGGTLQLGDGGTTGSLSPSSAILNNSSLVINRSNTVTQGTDFGGAPIAGSGSLTHVGSGTTFLTAANTYSGITILAGGVVNVATLSDYGSAGALGNRAGDTGGEDMGLLFRGGVLQYTGATAQSTNRALRISTSGGATIDASGSDPSATMTFSRAISSPNMWENGGTRDLNLTGSNTGNNTFAHPIEDITGVTTFNLNKNGVGTWVVSGNNNYRGITNINAGTLIAASSTALGVGGHNGATMSFIQDGATLGLQGGVSLDEHFHVWGAGVGGLGAVRSISGNNALTNAPGGGAGYALRSNTTVGVEADTLTVSGFYEEAGNFSLTKVGAGTLNLTIPNTYSGTTTISNGTLALSGGGRLVDTGAVVLTSSTSTFEIAGINTASEKISTLTGVAGSTVKLGGNALDLGDGTAEFAGNLEGTGGGLTKSGSGVQKLSGNNTYSGTTNISAGTLLLGSNTALPSTAALTLSGGTLNTDGYSASTGALSVNSASILDLGAPGGTSVLAFNSVGAWAGVLSIWNYTGAAWTSGSDKLTFANTAGINLSQVAFFSDNGVTPVGTGGGGLIPYGGGSELVPVPEASTLLSGVLLLGIIGYRERRKAKRQAV